MCGALATWSLPTKFESLGWGLAGRGVVGASKHMCMSLGVYVGCLTMVRWRIDQAMAWPGIAAGLAKLGRTWLGFVWGLGPSNPRGSPGQAWPGTAQLQACPKPAQDGPKQAMALQALAVGQPQPPLPSQALAGGLLAEV